MYISLNGYCCCCVWLNLLFTESFRHGTWWRHPMEIFSAWLALCAGNSPVPGEFPTQRPVTQSFDVFFDLRLNKRLSKQPWGWWFETPSWSLWRQCNECVFYGISHGHYTVISHQLWNTIHLLERYRIANRNHYNIDNTGLVNRYYRKLIRTLSAKHGVHIFAMAEWTYFCGMYVLKAYLGYILTISLVLYNMKHPI